MQELLLSSPDVAIGLERYGQRLMDGYLTPSDFELPRFFDVCAGDTFYDSLDFFPNHAGRLRDHYSNARYVGDKVPMAFRKLDWIAANFAPVRFVVLFRDLVDVAASYEARRALGTFWDPDWGVRKAVEHWNACVAAVLPWMSRPNLIPVEYEALATDASVVTAIARFLDVDAGPLVKMWQIQRQYGPSRVSGAGYERLSKADLEVIAKTADLGGWARIRSRAREFVHGGR
jgi:hypothetical protein